MKSTWVFKQMTAMVILLLCFTYINCGGNPDALEKVDTFDRIKKDGVIRVGYIVTPPWIIRDPQTGVLSGTSVDAINEIARLMEVKVEFVEATWATFIAGLQTDRYDLSIAPTFATVPRAMSVAFSRPQMYVGNSAIIRKGDSRFVTLADIDRSGIIVAVTQGEQGYEYAKANFKNAIIKEISNQDQSVTFAEVLAGRADVALGDAWFTAAFANEHTEAHDLFANKPYNLTPVAWAVRQSDTKLLNFINTCIDYLDSIDKLQEWDRKYNAKWLRPKKLWETS